MNDRPAAELKQIALDIHKGLIFTDRHITEPATLPGVFMLFLFMTEQQRDKLETDPPGLIFEYLAKAGSRAINGEPTFLSLQMLSANDTKKVFDICQKLQQAEQATLSE